MLIRQCPSSGNAVNAQRNERNGKRKKMKKTDKARAQWIGEWEQFGGRYALSSLHKIIY